MAAILISCQQWPQQNNVVAFGEMNARTAIEAAEEVGFEVGAKRDVSNITEVEAVEDEVVKNMKVKSARAENDRYLMPVTRRRSVCSYVSLLRTLL